MLFLGGVGGKTGFLARSGKRRAILLLNAGSLTALASHYHGIKKSVMVVCDFGFRRLIDFGDFVLLTPPRVIRDHKTVLRLTM